MRRRFTPEDKKQVLNYGRLHPEKTLIEIHHVFPYMSKMVIYTWLNDAGIVYSKRNIGVNRRIKKTTTNPTKFFEHDPYYKF